jgi:hypothetical protein
VNSILRASRGATKNDSLFSQSCRLSKLIRVSQIEDEVSSSHGFLRRMCVNEESILLIIINSDTDTRLSRNYHVQSVHHDVIVGVA